MADSDEGKRLLDSTPNGRNGDELEDKEIELSVSSEITRGACTLLVL